MTFIYKDTECCFFFFNAFYARTRNIAKVRRHRVAVIIKYARDKCSFGRENSTIYSDIACRATSLFL